MVGLAIVVHSSSEQVFVGGEEADWQGFQGECLDAIALHIMHKVQNTDLLFVHLVLAREDEEVS